MKPYVDQVRAIATMAHTRAVGRRAGAVLASLLVPGAGHVLLGRWRRALVFPAALIVVVLSIPVTKTTGVAAIVAVYLAMIIDALRVRVDLRPRAVPLVAGWAGFLVVLIGCRALLVSYYIETLTVSSTSMSPALLAGDRIIVNKLRRPPARGDIILHRGAVVEVYLSPGHHHVGFVLPDGTDVGLHDDHPDTYFVHRVVARGGDELAIRDGTLFLNGEPRQIEASEDCELWYPHLQRREYLPMGCRFERPGPGSGYLVTHSAGSPRDFPHPTREPYVVPNGTVFVLSDNRTRNKLTDSRLYGPVAIDDIVGTVSFIWWSSGPDGVRWSRIGTLLR
jgi:signal peptidase I